MAGLCRVRKLSQINPCAAIHWLQLFGGTTGLGARLAGRGLAALSCGVFLSRWQFIKVQPYALVIVDVLLKFLDFMSA